MSTKNKNEKIFNQNKLKKLKNQEGVVGYILRSQDSASIDLKDPSKVITYAVLSASAFETGERFANLFQLGGVDTVLLEGEAIKVMTHVVNKHRLSVFMEKNVDCEKTCANLISESN